MLNHVTLLKFASRATDADVEELVNDLDRLPESIVEIQMLEFGPNVMPTPRSYDFAIVALFANEETLGRYLQHPHYRAVEDKIEQMSERIVRVDFFGSDAGSLREKPFDNWVLGDDYSKP